MSHPLQIRIDKTLLNRFDKALKADGLSRSHILLQAVREYVENFEERQQQGREKTNES